MQPDLVIPPVSDGHPGPGKRVRQFHGRYTGTRVYHALYLPTDWVPGGNYPVIAEYAGNRHPSCPGTVEGSHLGYGVSGGKGVLWVCLPFVDRARGHNAATWWGDVDATVEYCRETVRRTCADYGGDPSNVFLAGFSRGAIACNFIGLHDDRIAVLWRGFICHSHYDGVREWGYPEGDRPAAARRLARLGDRPQFISNEESVAATRRYLAQALPSGRFTFLSLPFADHTDAWVLRDIPERTTLRKWFRSNLASVGQEVPAGSSRKRASGG